jgi:hypothetical protein
MAARILVAIALMLSLFERDRRENVAITSRHDKSRSRSRPRQAGWIQANYAGALSLDGMSDKQIIAAPQEPQSHKALLRLARQSAYSADVYSNLEAFFYTRGAAAMRIGHSSRGSDYVAAVSLPKTTMPCPLRQIALECELPNDK